MTSHHPARTSLSVLGVVLLLAPLANGLATQASANAGSSTHRSGQSVQIVRITNHDFDWGDAGIGAAAGIGISMLAIGATLIVTQTRREQPPRSRLTTKEQQ